MGSISSTWVEPTGTADPNPNTVVDLTTPVDPEPKYVDMADPEDIRILNWIGKFVKPLEERIVMLERQVELLSSLQNPPVVEVRTKGTE